MKGKDFIITGLQPWDIPIGSNAIDIAKEISLHNRVLYVNAPLDQMTLWRNKNQPEIQHRLKVLNKEVSPLRQISPNLWVLDFPFSIFSNGKLPDGFLFDLVNKLNNKKIFTYVQKIADELNFKNFIHIIDNDIYRSFYAREYLKASLFVYYRRDNLLPFEFWKKHAPRLEPMLIAKSDLIICNSPQLADVARKSNPKSFDIGQGVDLSAYNPDIEFNIPENLIPISKPIVGYIGDITSVRLNPDLIYDVAKQRPDYSFVMIGREDPVFQAHVLHTLGNVHFLGSIAKNTVPQYMNFLDVCLNPQLLNEVTNGNYPRKVDEYLAMGKPVVATKTATMELFKDHSYLCTNALEYVAAIDDALKNNSIDKRNGRIEFARSHSWENNVNNIYKLIQ